MALRLELQVAQGHAAQAGLGLFPAPSPIAGEVCRQYDVRSIGTIESVRQRFYAITVDRKIKHPAVIAICESPRRRLFQ